jgi:guanine deaminase
MKEEDKQDIQFMQEAIALALKGVNSNEGGPFGAVVVKDGVIIGRGNNQVIITNDPTAHAEVVAIKDACRTVNSFLLDGCVIYTSCEPCPMCLGAIYWARIEKIFYACTKKDAAAIGFDDAFIYEELLLSLSERKIKGISLIRDEGLKAFTTWREKADKTPY